MTCLHKQINAQASTYIDKGIQQERTKTNNQERIGRESHGSGAGARLVRNMAPKRALKARIWSKVCAPSADACNEAESEGLEPARVTTFSPESDISKQISGRSSLKTSGRSQANRPAMETLGAGPRRFPTYPPAEGGRGGPGTTPTGRRPCSPATTFGSLPPGCSSRSCTCASPRPGADGGGGGARLLKRRNRRS